MYSYNNFLSVDNLKSLTIFSLVHFFIICLVSNCAIFLSDISQISNLFDEFREPKNNHRVRRFVHLQDFLLWIYELLQFPHLHRLLQRSLFWLSWWWCGTEKWIFTPQRRHLWPSRLFKWTLHSAGHHHGGQAVLE